MCVCSPLCRKTQGDWYSYSLHEDKGGASNNVSFQHFYEVQNFGVSAVEEAVLTVRVPTRIQRLDGEIVIASINDTVLRMNGQELFCGDVSSLERIASMNMITVNEDSSAANSTKFSVDEIAPSGNKTFYINCTNRAIQCEEIDCRLGPFLSSLYVAKFLVTLDLQLPNFPADVMKDYDIILYATEGSVTVTQPGNISQMDGHKPDVTLVTTKFFKSPTAQQISAWIIVLSVILGIVLLILLILGLIKLGFFHRKKKLELKALKAETDIKYNVVLEITSSTEALDLD